MMHEEGKREKMSLILFELQVLSFCGGCLLFIILREQGCL